MKITLPYPPTANRYWAMTTNKKTGVPFLFPTGEAKAFKRNVQAACFGMKPLDGPVCMTVIVYREMRNRDLMNCEKILSDSLQGFAFVNDKQIVESHWFLRDDKTNPRVEVEIESV